ncbi:MAG: DUF177 domain-containing protein [Microbacteriaceae bacterium]|nr:DUF177 domain-containing protein [Microbacteriaceae bacterium]
MPTSPYVVNVSSLLQKPGSMRELELDITAPERIGEGLIHFAEGAELELDLRLESLHDGILATADVRGTLTGQCSRCLQDVSEPWSGHFAELFGLQADEALVYIVENEAVDLEGPLRDTVVLDLPFQPLCEPDCLGLDPATGEKLTEPLPEPEDEIDPRWAQLQQLLDDKQ